MVSLFLAACHGSERAQDPCGYTSWGKDELALSCAAHLACELSRGNLIHIAGGLQPWGSARPLLRVPDWKVCPADQPRKAQGILHPDSLEGPLPPWVHQHQHHINLAWDSGLVSLLAWVAGPTKILRGLC